MALDHIPQSIARTYWSPSNKERRALIRHKHVEGLGRVDQIWPFLAENYGEVLAVEAPHAAHPEAYNFAELAERISSAAVAFRSFGIGSGDVVALFSENSPRWLVADQGVMRTGASDAVRGALAPVEELQYILEDSGAVALVIQSADLWKKLELTDEQRKRLRVIVQLEGIPKDGVLSWEYFLDQAVGKSSSDLLTERDLANSSETVATILYTSGTTGKPKGVPLTHANLLHQMRSLACVAHPPAGSHVLSVLPIWHSYERSAEYYFFSCACTQSYTTIKHFKEDLPRVKPIVMATVPRLWEAVQAGFEEALKTMPPFRQRLLRVALSNSTSYKFALRKARQLLIVNVPFLHRLLAAFEALIRLPAHILSSIILWPKVLDKLVGGKLLFPINGGGAIAPHVDAFFEALGVNLLVGYGLTETSPVVTCRRPWRNIRGSSGLPLPETELQIVDLDTGAPKSFMEQGLVLVRGPQVMHEYLHRPEATAQVLNSEGWFNTGDIGMLLLDGSLVLTGRSKDTIVLSNGENIEPSPLEESLVASNLFEQVMLVGQDERQLGILIVPNFATMYGWARNKGLIVDKTLGGYLGDLELRRLLRREVNDLLSKRVGSRPDERVMGVALVEPFTVENGLLTQTLKQRRAEIYERDKSAIASIFQS